MPEPTTIIVAGAKVGAGIILKKFLEWLNADQKALRDAWNEQLEELNFETRRILDRVVSNLGEIAAAVDEQQAKRAFSAVTLEALRSTDVERLRMLAAAFVGFVTVDMEAEARSRAYRTALQLEPSDVIFLRQLSEWEMEARRAWRDYARSEPHAKAPDISHQPLVERFAVQLSATQAAGCVGELDAFANDVSFATPVPVVNSVGKSVLQLLAEYQGSSAATHPPESKGSRGSGLTER